MQKLKKNLWLCLLMLGITKATLAQDSTQLAYVDYISTVGAKNLAYAAERFNLDIALAGVEMAKVFPDPDLALGAQDNDHRRTQLGYEFSAAIEYTLSFGGKRKAGIRLARSESELAELLLNDYFRNMRADATLSYLEALKENKVFETRQASYASMQALALADSIRFKLGDITDMDARQSKLEAKALFNEVLQSEADRQAALSQLNLWLGMQQAPEELHPQGDFELFDRVFELADLQTAAQNNRADLLAALKSKEVSQRTLQLAKANRAIDLGLSLGITSVSVVRNKVAPTPSMNQLALGVSIPLKFSNNNKGELKAASFAVKQSEMAYNQVVLEIQTEVKNAWLLYKTSEKQLAQFNTGLLSDALKILEGKTYSYQRGESSLLEVLDARRTYNEIQITYYETLHNHAAALVELERSAGIWDINF